jgi:hypothetical protein
MGFDGTGDGFTVDGAADGTALAWGKTLAAEVVLTLPLFAPNTPADAGRFVTEF